MKKKILLVITKSNFGGAQRYVYDLAVTLPRERYSVKVVFGGSGLLQKKLDSKHIAVIPIPGLTRDVGFLREWTAFFALIKIFREERPDVVHLNSSKAGGLGALAARIARVPRIVFTAHGWAFNEDRFFITKTLLYLLHYITVLLSHTTIAVSENVRDQITFFPFIQQKIVVIRNGIDSFPLRSKKEAREELSKNDTVLHTKQTDEQIWVGTISELHKTKGLTYALQAIKEVTEILPNIVFVIMGEGEQREELERQIRTENLHQHVFLLGHIDNASSYLSALDIFTLSSISEGLPYTLLEAGHAGLPVVTSRVGGIPEVITHNEIGYLVSAKESHAIATALRHLINSPSARAQMGEFLKKRIVGSFTLTKMCENTEAVYDASR